MSGREVDDREVDGREVSGREADLREVSAPEADVTAGADRGVRPGVRPVGAGRAVRVVVVAVTVAVVANLAVHALGRAAGGSFLFTSPRGPVVVEPVVVATFTAVPLLLGLVVAVLLARRWSWVLPTATVVAPSLALGTVLVMTIPADLDAVSTVTLAACHVVLVPVSVLALRALRDPAPRAGAGAAGGAAQPIVR